MTSSREQESDNFGQAGRLDHATRYARAAEFVEVATKLWDSWEDDAVLLDRAGGDYTDVAKLHPVRHRGRWFSVRGPLTLPRSPQGRPLLVQAGSSPDGREFAAAHAEAVFTAQQTLAGALEFATDLRARAARLGRAAGEPLVLPGICPVLGATERQARELEAELTALQVPRYGLTQLSSMLEVDLRDADLDARLPRLPDPSTVQGNRSRYRLVVDMARAEDLTIRQILARLGGGRGHRVLAGTPEQVADEIEQWFRAGAADGFNVMPPLLPSGLEDFVDQVVPLLQRRGLFRTAYTATTLRGHYGLPRPPSRYAGADGAGLPAAGG